MAPDLDLSSRHIQAWLALQPADMRRVIPDDASPDADSAIAEVVGDLEATAPRRFLDVIDLHAGAIATMGRARRIRLMSWLVNRCWPDTNLPRDLMRGSEEDDEGSGSKGRDKVAPLFLSDYMALRDFTAGRTLSGVRSIQNVDAVHRGVQVASDSVQAGF